MKLLYSFSYQQKITLFIFLIVFVSCIVLFVGYQKRGEPPVSLILDTDIASDVDDVGAVALLHGLANQGKVLILAEMVSSGNPWSAGCLEAVNAWFNRQDIPVGVVGGKSVQDSSKYTKAIAREFGSHDSTARKEFPDAVQLYRRVLSGQPDKSVTVVTIGYLTNLHNLLLSKPDLLSPLDGISLVRKKVKRLVCMGGEYPVGREWNFYRDAQATVTVVQQWPTPIVFCGFEIGKDILTGSVLRNNRQPGPVRRSYELYNGLTDRPSWDQVTVYYAVTSSEERKSTFWFKVYGQNKVHPDGSNSWLNECQDGCGEQAFLKQHGKKAVITALIEQLMLTTP